MMAARILLVEDDRFLRRAAEAMLRKQGFDVRVAADGEEGLAAARGAVPDLVLLDLIMPKMQGFTVLEALKADPATAGVPVIIMSNLGQDSDIARAMAAGAAAYFIKSNTALATLAEQVRRVLDDRAA
jgi:CheY-like chemotaxis protein